MEQAGQAHILRMIPLPLLEDLRENIIIATALALTCTLSGRNFLPKMKLQHNFFIFVAQCHTLGFAKSFPESGLNGDYSTLYVRDTAAVSTGTTCIESASASDS